MKLTIETDTQPVDLFSLEVQELQCTRRVYIDDKRLPTTLEQIFLCGLDSATGEYLDQIEKEMKGKQSDN